MSVNNADAKSTSLASVPPNDDERAPLLAREPSALVDYSRATLYIILLNVGLMFVLYGFQNIWEVYFQFLGFGGPTRKGPLPGVLTNVFTAIAYIFSLIGGFLADTYLGLYNTIVIGSMLMFFSLFFLVSGNVVDAVGVNSTIINNTVSQVVLDTAAPALTYADHVLIVLSFIGISVFVVGTGLTKATMSAFIGEQFNPGQEEKRTRYYSWYYLSIQVGSIAAIIGAPLVFNLRPFGPWLTFSILAGSMFVFLPIFLYGRTRLRRRAPKGSVYSTVFRIIGSAWRNRRIPHLHWLDCAKIDFPDSEVEDVKTLGRVLTIFVPLPFFWAIFFQLYSVWVVQAEEMNRFIGSWLVPAPITNTLNPIFDVILIPLFASGLYPALQKCGLNVTPLRKIAVGHIFTILALVVAGFVEIGIANAPDLVFDPATRITMKDFSIWWIVPQYFLVSCAEILLSVTIYEFAYTQAPKSMKGLMSGLLMITIAVGNGILAGLQGIDGSRSVMNFAYAGGIGVVFLLFLVIAVRYQYTVEEEPAKQ